LLFFRVLLFNITGGSSGITWGVVFIIILFSAITLYLVVGILVSYFVFNKRGIEVVPLSSFWVLLPQLVFVCVSFLYLLFYKEGFKFIFYRCKGNPSQFTPI
jgi:hypothetical protein